MGRLKIKYKRELNTPENLVRKIGLILITIILICIFLPKQPRFRYEFQKGKVWNHENLISPYNFAILKTQEELNADKKSILNTIQPIYNANTTRAKSRLINSIPTSPKNGKAVNWIQHMRISRIIEMPAMPS